MVDLRSWQVEALALWQQQKNRGIVSVVTGGGKTIFALACFKATQLSTCLVVVPSNALLEQWWEESASFFNLSLNDINIVNSSHKIVPGTINISIINTVAKWSSGQLKNIPKMLIVDECHRAASCKFRSCLEINHVACLGLSATPERQYDDGLDSILVPKLGPVFYEYTYADALRDRVITPFDVNNVIFELEPHVREEYDSLTKKIALSISKLGIESEKTLSLLIKRTRVLNSSWNRVRLAVKIAMSSKNRKVIIFHENIDMCNAIFEILKNQGISVGNYHSKLSLRERADILYRYRNGGVDMIVTCKALDEGFNVPSTEVGIIAAATSTKRQRIQRLGRILRPALGKDKAIIYSLVASHSEILRMKEEEQTLGAIANINWSKA